MNFNAVFWMNFGARRIEGRECTILQFALYIKIPMLSLYYLVLGQMAYCISSPVWDIYPGQNRR